MEKVSFNNEEFAYKKSEKMLDIIFRQELNSFTPNCNIRCAVICNLIMIFLFIILGAPIVALSYSIVEYNLDYTNCNLDENKICKIPLILNQKLDPPINVYYTLTKFFLNQRDLARSRSFPQLRNQVDKANYSRCEGALTVGEMFDFREEKYENPWKVNLDPNSIASPCGLAAKSYFNDSYFFTDPNLKTIYINDSNIANDYDKEYMFKREDNYKQTQWVDVENEHFIVWMQTESFSDFMKLYGRIEKTLEPGTYYFYIKSNYNVTTFGGTKGLLLSTGSSLGRSSFLGWILISGAFMCSLTVLVLLLFLYNKGNILMDINNMKWK